MSNRENTFLEEDAEANEDEDRITLLGEKLYQRLDDHLKREYAGEWIAFDVDSGHYAVRPELRDAIGYLIECCGSDISVYTKLMPRILH